jgi:hypothetical protein
VHANGDVVCSIIDGRGDFVLGNVHQQSLTDIFGSARARELRRLVLSTDDCFCAAIGKRCPLKNLPIEPGEQPSVRLRFLAIEPTTACDLRCLSCPIRDIAGDVNWRDAYRDGGASFLLWDGLRRTKQHAADAVRRAIPLIGSQTPPRLGRPGVPLLRGRIPRSRCRKAAGTGIEVIWRYVVFRWNDRDDQFRRAIDMAEARGIPIFFDFAQTWGRSRRAPDGLRDLAPYLKPFTALPGEAGRVVRTDRVIGVPGRFGGSRRMPARANRRPPGGRRTLVPSGPSR